MNPKRHNLSNSALIEQIPLACQNETVAVEFFEKQRWGDTPCCIHCGSVDVYKMLDAKTGERSKRFLWRCRDCKKQYTVRIGMVYEESRLPMRHWAYAFWRAATSKKGVAALEIKRHCQINYISALFLMNRIRFAMAPDPGKKLTGVVECDEAYLGGKHTFKSGIKKTPVFVAVERNGRIRRRVMKYVTKSILNRTIREMVDTDAKIMTDQKPAYNGLTPDFASHETVCHSTREYVRGDVHTNTAESSNALIQRGLMGIYHNVSPQYLHRYLWQWDFCWNHRKMNDGERTIAAIQAAQGKRLMFMAPSDPTRFIQ
jgi:hypothetical protein